MNIALGMSGGVDSSVSAVLLKEAGHNVTGVFLECWKAPGCRAEEDRKDALAIALQLEIPFQVLDFKDAYKSSVVEYFFAEYAAGRTPNPDVLCNKEIKFGLFYDWAMEHGFDAIATGHYAQIQHTADSRQLTASTDKRKDQTYFLYRLRQEQLEHIVFPIGHLTKSEVRKLAGEFSLPTATKPDSQGICFIGEINIHEFLKERLGENPGDVVDTKGRVIGTHKGLWFYTIGQRHGFEIKVDSNSFPANYVIAKDAKNNRLVVGFGAEAFSQDFSITDMHWIDAVSCRLSAVGLTVRIRHGGELFPCTLTRREDDSYLAHLSDPIQGIADGQSAVFYRDGVCLGGGIISVM